MGKEATILCKWALVHPATVLAWELTSKQLFLYEKCHHIFWFICTSSIELPGEDIFWTTRICGFKRCPYLSTKKKKKKKMVTNVICHTDMKVHVYLYLMCSTAIWKSSLFRKQNKLQNILFNPLLISRVRWCLKHFLVSMLICFVASCFAFVLL